MPAEVRRPCRPGYASPVLREGGDDRLSRGRAELFCSFPLAADLARRGASGALGSSRISPRLFAERAGTRARCPWSVRLANRAARAPYAGGSEPRGRN